MKFESVRITNWFDTSTLTPVYGIKVKVNGVWLNYAEDGKAVLGSRAKMRDKRDLLKAAT